MTPARKKWLLTGGMGAVLFCGGLCGVVESGFLKYSGVPVWQWVVAGTLALVVLMLGMVLLQKAAKLEDGAKNK